VGADPIAAAGYRSIDDRNGASVRRLVHETHNLPVGHAVHEFGAVLLRIAVQAARVHAKTDDIDQRNTRLHQIRGQPVHRQILVVANDQAPGGIEHHHALRHVVERERKQTALAVEPRASRQSH
jgi:hypothetical protein